MNRLLVLKMMLCMLMLWKKLLYENKIINYINLIEEEVIIIEEDIEVIIIEGDIE